MAVAMITKQEAREAFGWVPKEERGTPSYLMSLKEKGLETKEQIKEYMRSTVMPANTRTILNKPVQAEEQQVISKPKQTSKKSTVKRDKLQKAEAKSRFETGHTHKALSQEPQLETGLGMKMQMYKR